MEREIIIATEEEAKLYDPKEYKIQKIEKVENATYKAVKVTRKAA